ncbi:MAG TPA: phosphate ABC transporter ATP-binding protein [bacterium]|nr:phosphate ABC transporter ATP-binding protein [bacterium]
MVTAKISCKKLNAWFGKVHSVRSLDLDIRPHEIFGIIGPANSGKTTFLRTLNRMNDLDLHFRMDGEVLLDGQNIYADMTAEALRSKVGMVFAMPMPLPMSVFDNVAYGPRMHGMRDRKKLAEIVERSLQEAFLWEEVKDRLGMSGMKLSGGQQQRLCIARTLALSPDVILFDEPCSGLDPISTAKVEEAMLILKKEYTIILVTNNIKQAARVSGRTAFFLMGELIELDATEKIFTAPKDKRTEDYILGRFG